MPSSAASRPAPVIASPRDEGQSGGHARRGRGRSRAASWPSALERGHQRGADGAAGAGEQDPHECPSSPIRGRIKTGAAQTSRPARSAMSDASASDDVAAGEGALRTWMARGVADEQEVVDEAAVAGDGLGADAGEAGVEVARRHARHVAAGLARRTRAARRRGAARLRCQRRAIASAGQQHVAQVAGRSVEAVAVARADEQRGRPEQDVAVDRAA